MMNANAETTMTTNESPLYICSGEWEHSQYDDSDFYRVVYDPIANVLSRYMTFTTRFPAYSNPRLCGIKNSGFEDAAKKALEDMLFSRIKHEETQRVMEPSIKALVPGTRIRFTEAHSCVKKEKTQHEEECSKCEGRGKWINPRNEADKRDCFACKGTGKVTVTRRVKVETKTVITKGKNKGQEKVVRDWEFVDAGTTGVVKGQATFGRFYRNGYNTPDRSNTTVYITLDDGREVQAPAKKLRMDKEVPSERVMRAHANDLAFAPENEPNGVNPFNLYYEQFATARTAF